jgi:hypothetical protein
LDFSEVGEPFGPLIPKFLDLIVYLATLALSVAIQAKKFKVRRQRVDELVGCTCLIIRPAARIIVS